MSPPAGAKAPDEAAVVVSPPPAPPRLDAIYRRGKQRRAKGDYIAAICDFDEVLRAKPDFAWCYYDRAGAYTLMGNQSAALADLDRALAIMPTEPKLWRAHAVVRHRMGEIVARRPDCPSARMRRAAAYYANGQFDKALDDLNVALRLRPRPAQAFKLRSELHERRADYAAALADTRAAQRLDPGNSKYIERIDELLSVWAR